MADPVVGEIPSVIPVVPAVAVVEVELPVVNSISETVVPAQPGVELVIIDEEGVNLGTFVANDKDSILEIARANNVEIPSSCEAGACFVCACQVTEGMQDLEQDKLGIALVDVEPDQFLTCIWGLKAWIFTDGGYHKIVLKKLMS